MGFQLGAVVDHAARAAPSSVAVAQRDHALTYGELHRHCLQAANGLGTLGVGQGDRVAYLGPNSSAWVEVVVGAARIGAVAVPVNTRLLPHEQAEILDDAEAKVLIVDSAIWEDLRGHVGSAGRAVLVLQGDYEPWRDRQSASSEMAPPDPAADCLQLYTSGTTGPAKGVRITNENLRWLITQGAEHVGMRPGLRGLVTLPQFHIAGGGFTLMALSLGGTLTLPRELSTESIVADIAEFKITNTGMVPTTLQTILDRPDIDVRDLASLSDVIYGAAPIPAALLDRVLTSVGCGFYHTYGLTETCGFVTVMSPQEHDPDMEGRLASCGRALPWVELSIREVSGASLPVGELGEICIRSPQVSPGYWRRPEATAAAFHRGRWLRTGDIGAVDDDGFTFIVDRLKDLIITGGENVAPAEVEAVLLTHPSVSQVAVVGAPHEHWGETVVAVVVPVAATSADGDALIEFARERLAHFKCPTAVRFVQALPLNATGKVDKGSLRAGGSRGDRPPN